MRKLSVILALMALCIIAAPVRAQHYVGVRGGYGAASGRFEPKPSKSKLVMGKYTGGVSWRYFSPLRILGGVGVDLEFQQRGYLHLNGASHNIGPTDNYISTERSVGSVTLPLVWYPHFYLARRHLRVYAVAGVSVSYNTDIGGSVTTTNYVYDADTKTQTSTSVTVDYRMNTARDVRWGYGWLGGAGFEVMAGRWSLAAEGRYYYGMSDVLRNKVKYPFHEGSYGSQLPLRSELNNIFVTVGVYYRLGKGGILAPTRRAARPTSRGDNFRNIKPNL